MLNSNKDKNRVAAEMIISSACNLNCKYCYIPKTKELNNLNTIIRNKISNGEYLQYVIDTFGSENISSLSFWGAEPTLSLDVFTEEILKIYMLKLPNLKTFNFSTNLIKGADPIITFIKSLPKTKSLDVSIQFSIDGPPIINDLNRGEGTTDKILNNLYDFITKLNSVDFGPHNISLHNKITWNAGNLQYFIEDLHRLEEYISFFENMRSNVKNLSTSKLKYNIVFWTNCECPGNYTSQDGKNYAIVFKKLIEIKNNWPYKSPPMDFQTHGLDKLFEFGDEYYNKQKMFTCSAGDSQFAINWENKISPCHRSVFFNEEQISKHEKNYAQLLKDKYVISADDKYEEQRLIYLMTTYHHFTKLKVNNTIAIIKELIEVGQISETYKDYNKAYLLALYTQMHHCSPEAIIEHGSLYAPLISLIRLYGNGALEILVTAVKEKYDKSSKK